MSRPSIGALHNQLNTREELHEYVRSPASIAMSVLGDTKWCPTCPSRLWRLLPWSQRAEALSLCPWQDRDTL